MQYKVTITYRNGTVRTVKGSFRYCTIIRNQAYRMCHGWFPIVPI